MQHMVAHPAKFVAMLGTEERRLPTFVLVPEKGPNPEKNMDSLKLLGPESLNDEMLQP